MTKTGTITDAYFLLIWVLGHLLASVAGSIAYPVSIIVFYLLHLRYSGLLQSTTFQAVGSVIELGIMFAILGFFLGFVQWLILRLRIPTPRAWFWLTTLGWGIIGCLLSLVIDQDLSGTVTAIIFGGLSGFIVGFAQWLVLRRMAIFAGWWLGINAISYALAAWLMVPAIAEVYIALGLIVASAISGLGLLWILKSSNSS